MTARSPSSSSMYAGVPGRLMGRVVGPMMSWAFLALATPAEAAPAPEVVTGPTKIAEGDDLSAFIKDSCPNLRTDGSFEVTASGPLTNKDWGTVRGRWTLQQSTLSFLGDFQKEHEESRRAWKVSVDNVVGYQIGDRAFLAGVQWGEGVVLSCQGPLASAIQGWAVVRDAHSGGRVDAIEASIVGALAGKVVFVARELGEDAD
jgi:hypothetical protein